MGKVSVMTISGYLVQNADESITLVIGQGFHEVQITVESSNYIRPEQGEYGITVDTHEELLKLVRKGS